MKAKQLLEQIRKRQLLRGVPKIIPVEKPYNSIRLHRSVRNVDYREIYNP